MPARAAIHSLLENDPILGNIGVEAVYPANAVDTPAEDLFVIVRWGEGAVAFKTRGSDRLAVWAHDKNRDYGRIDEVLERVKTLLTETLHRPGADGYTFTMAEWNGNGPDLVDGGYNTVTRYSEFTVVSRYSSD